jgi:hypothetical protein
MHADCVSLQGCNVGSDSAPLTVEFMIFSFQSIKQPAAQRANSKTPPSLYKPLSRAKAGTQSFFLSFFLSQIKAPITVM